MGWREYCLELPRWDGNVAGIYSICIVEYLEFVGSEKHEEKLPTRTSLLGQKKNPTSLFFHSNERENRRPGCASNIHMSVHENLCLCSRVYTWIVFPVKRQVLLLVVYLPS